MMKHTHDRKMTPGSRSSVGLRIPAAMYYQTSAEASQPSTREEEATIRGWAERNGYEIVETFADEARSGACTSSFSGLDRLSQAVISGTARFKAILAYDPWVWSGPRALERDQHEWLFAKLGIEIQYCEPEYRERAAQNAHLIQTVKRALAGDFSKKRRRRRPRRKSKEAS